MSNIKKDINGNTKSSQIKPRSHKENETIYRLNNNRTDKTYTHFNPDFEQVDELVERTIDDCRQHFRRYKYKYVFVVNLSHATHGTTNYCSITDRFENQYERINEEN